MKLLTDTTVENQFSTWSRGVAKAIKAEREAPKVEPPKLNVVAHKKIEGNKKKLIYVEMGQDLHLVTDGNFLQYIHLRRNCPHRLILFSTRKELIQEVEKKGYLV